MEYDFREIEQKWQQIWRERKTYKVTEDPSKPKFYGLDMFPYPSGAGLHVGHPLGYIASDIIARYKRHQGFNVLHPMGYDSFGLPAEQYAIQTGQHPEVTTRTNIARYREQLDKIGFAFDWDREVRTSDPEYYRWTQWIFGLIYNSWFNTDTQKVEPISVLIEKFATNGSYNVNAAIEEDWYKKLDRSKFPLFGKNFEGEFTATDWQSMNEEQQQLLLMNYRMAYLADSVVNWCPALGTVLANDEVKDGKSERGGHPVEQKLMRQWSMRITAYAQRLLDGLETIDWPENIREVQRNWIGRSEGASIRFKLDGHDADIEVFTTRPDTIFGVSFMTLAPEHELVLKITTDEYRDAIEKYIANAKLKTERDRQADVKNVSGQFTGAHVIHPFTGEKIPVWIGEYVLAGYGTGAVMAVPAGDQRDWDFAKKFNLPIPNIFEGIDISEKAEASKEAVLTNSDILNGLSYKAATKKIIAEIEAKGIGKGKINYRMRDAVFSRQRYWGEPFPVYYKNEIPYLVDDDDLPIELPEVDKYLPTADGEPPLARAEGWRYVPGERPHSIASGSGEAFGLTPSNSPHPRPLPTTMGTGEAFGLTPNPSPVERGEEELAFSKKTFTVPHSEALATWNKWQTANSEIWERLKQRSRDMRKNPTFAEETMWQLLRNGHPGHKIRRQHAIAQFIVDFVCLDKRLAIEIDGPLHLNSDQKLYDEARTLYLNVLGFELIRFTNDEVANDSTAVFNKIKSALNNRKSVKENIEAQLASGIQDASDAPLSTGEGSGVRPNSKDANYHLEYNTMPGWAGSSWYFLRYMDPHNSNEFAAREKTDYWNQVDLYIGGAEHATGHLLYSRFWTKVLADYGYIGFDEPFKKMINQGMILGRSSHVYRINGTNTFVTSEKKDSYDTQQLYADISLVENDVLNIPKFKAWLPEYANAEFILNDKGEYLCTWAIDKMSKRWFNVANPDELCDRFGADTLRMYEMFLGPLEQAKPWDTNGITGVHNFLRKFWRLSHDKDNNFIVNDNAPTKAELKTLHTAIKKVSDDLNRYSWNTVVSTLMICVNELTEQKSNNREVIQTLTILLSPYAPHIAEELWEELGHSASITETSWPTFNEEFLKESEFEYPISFNGKTRFFIPLGVELSQEEVTKAVLAHEQTSKFLEGKEPKKIIVVPKRIVNVVV